MALDQGQLTAILKKAGWPTKDIPTALGIIGAESGGNPTIVGWDYAGATVADTGGPQPNTQWTSEDVGLFQINSSNDPNAPANTYDPTWISSMQDPVQNAKEAYSLFASRGVGPWSSDSYVKGLGSSGSSANVNAQVTGSFGPQPGPVSSSNPFVDWWDSILGGAKGIVGDTGSTVLKPVLSTAAKDTALAIVAAVQGVTGTGPPAELGLRFAEVFAGALLFALGLFLMFEALSGRSAGADIGTAVKIGAQGAKLAAI